MDTINSTRKDEAGVFMDHSHEDKKEAELRYMELTKGMVTPGFLADINNLLLQLSPGVRPCTNEWLNRMFDNGTRLFVTVDVNRIVGMVSLLPVITLGGQKDWIEDVVVDEDYHRLGIASQLMSMAERASRERGAESINLTSNPSREGARRMYTRRGFELRDTGVFRLKL